MGDFQAAMTVHAAEGAVRVHTTRVADGDGEVQQGLEDTLATIKRLVERQSVAS